MKIKYSHFQNSATVGRVSLILKIETGLNDSNSIHKKNNLQRNQRQLLPHGLQFTTALSMQSRSDKKANPIANTLQIAV